MPDGTMMLTSPMTHFEVRLSPADASAVASMAAGRGATSEEWIANLIRAHVTRKPQWFADDVTGFHSVASALRQIAEINKPVRGKPTEIGSVVLSRVLDAVIMRLDRSDDACLGYWGVSRTN